LSDEGLSNDNRHLKIPMVMISSVFGNSLHFMLFQTF
jgi:hypothetical protein